MSEGGTIHTDTAPITALETTQAKMASISIQTTTTGPPIKGPHGGSLYGTPLPQFTGAQSDSKAFLQKFKGWWLVNGDKPVFEEPYRWSALFLTFVNRKDVDNWVDQ